MRSFPGNIRTITRTCIVACEEVVDICIRKKKEDGLNI